MKRLEEYSEQQIPSSEHSPVIVPEREILDMNPEQLSEMFTKFEREDGLAAFLEDATNSEALIAQFSYWEKWLEKDQRILLDANIEKKRKIYDEIVLCFRTF